MTFFPLCCRSESLWLQLHSTAAVALCCAILIFITETSISNLLACVCMCVVTIAFAVISPLSLRRTRWDKDMICCVTCSGVAEERLQSGSGTLVISQSCVMADPPNHLGCPVSKLGELLQLFLTSPPLDDHVL